MIYLLVRRGKFLRHVFTQKRFSETANFRKAYNHTSTLSGISAAGALYPVKNTKWNRKQGKPVMRGISKVWREHRQTQPESYLTPTHILASEDNTTALLSAWRAEKNSMAHCSRRICLVIGGSMSLTIHWDGAAKKTLAALQDSMETCVRIAGTQLSWARL